VPVHGLTGTSRGNSEVEIPDTRRTQNTMKHAIPPFITVDYLLQEQLHIVTDSIEETSVK